VTEKILKTARERIANQREREKRKEKRKGKERKEKKRKKRKEKEFRFKSLVNQVMELTLCFQTDLVWRDGFERHRTLCFSTGRSFKWPPSPARGHQTVRTNSEMVIRKKREEEPTRVHEGKKSVD